MTEKNDFFLKFDCKTICRFSRPFTAFIIFGIESKFLEINFFLYFFFIYILVQFLNLKYLFKIFIQYIFLFRIKKIILKYLKIKFF